MSAVRQKSGKRAAAWTISWIALAAAIVTGLLLSFGSYPVTLSEQTIQARIDAQLPKEHKGIEVKQAKIELGQGEMVAIVAMEGRKGGQNFDLVAYLRGIPEYESWDGEFFFRPKEVRIQEFHFRGTTPSTKLKEWSDRYVTNKGLQRLAHDTAPKVDAWITEAAEKAATAALTKMPVYTLKDEGKGFIVKSSLESVSVAPEGVTVTFSFWRFTMWMLTLVAVVIVAIIVMIVLIQNPGLFLAVEALGAVASAFD